MKQAYILPKDTVEKLDEMKQTIKELDITVDDLKDYYDTGYQTAKIGFIQE